MSTVKPTDKVLVNRAGTNYATSADMSTVKDTDLLLINRAGVDYKCTFADWKKSQPKAPNVGTVTLSDVAGGDRFTNVAFPVSATMTEDGTPTSTKKLKAYVEGALKTSAVIGPIVAVKTQVTNYTQYLTCSAGFAAPAANAFNGLISTSSSGNYSGWTTAYPRGTATWAFPNEIPFSTLKIYAALHMSTVGTYGNVQVKNNTSGWVAVTGFLGENNPNFNFNTNGLDTGVDVTSQVAALNGKINGLRFSADGSRGWGLWGIEIDGYLLVDAKQSTILTLDAAANVGLIHGKDAVQEVGNADDGRGTVGLVDPIGHTIELINVTGTWDVGSQVKGPPKAPVGGASVKLYCRLDTAGAVSDLQSADPGFTAWTPAGTGPYTGSITWPATLPSGQPPDTDLPAGTSLTVEVQASNTSGTDSAVSNTIVPA